MVAIHSDDLQFFKKELGDLRVLTALADLKTYGKDWTSGYEANPSCILLPKSTLEISTILKYCSAKNIPVVPSGGRTGLAGGATALNGEVVLSLEKMNQFIRVDPISMTIEADAGVITSVLQQKALEYGLFFPIDLAAKGSCQVGGNVATNAGGLKFIRYGGTREQVLGLEVVLANGEILNLNSSLRKNNTGYDLKQLFIGSEGTLGVITRVTLRLVTQPKSSSVVCVGVHDFAHIPEILKFYHENNLTLNAFEFFTEKALKVVLKQFSSQRPFQEEFPFYALIEREVFGKDSQEENQKIFEDLFEKELIADAVFPASSQETKDIWKLRENITEGLSREGFIRKNDITLPIHALSSFVKEVETINPYDDITLILFGHIGDGNIHINYLGQKQGTYEEFTKKAAKIEKKIFELIRSFSGSISAEHGIGLLKKDSLHYTRSPLEISLMKEVKKIFDPKNILNPGKIFDLLT